MATAAPQAQLLVIAAPRPFGLPDLERIQAGRTEGRFFVRAPLSTNIPPYAVWHIRCQCSILTACSNNEVF